MIELPEAVVIARQISETLCGKQIASAEANTSPLKFAWYTGNPAEYNQRLAGKVIGRASGVGGYVEIAAGNMLLAISAPIRYHLSDQKRPTKHQLLLEFEDGTAMSASAQMWGGFFCFPSGEKGANPDYEIAKKHPSPLTNSFSRSYFASLFNENTAKLSAKAFLATEQRIPGLGNGVLQDILWTGRIHPKRKMGELADREIETIYRAVMSVLKAMTAQGGRDTENDLFGCPGGYKTVLSKKTAGTPCPECGTTIRKESYLGGSIYVCDGCQEL